jgi:uncharacterized SAM-binding protein YcdF (DUF218 family)
MGQGPSADMPQAESKVRGKRQVIIPAVVIVGVLLFGAREPILLSVGDFLVIQDALKPADVIHVIAGPDDRTDYAIQLYKQGYGKQIFFTGGWCTFHGYYHGQHGAERAEAQGVEPESIAFDESRVTSTYDEAVLLKKFITNSQAPIRSVIVVSDAFHGRRAVFTYRLVLGDAVTVQFAAVPFEASTYQRRWWTDDASRQYVRQEYLKLAYYFARYQLGIRPVSDWLASLDQE